MLNAKTTLSLLLTFIFFVSCQNTQHLPNKNSPNLHLFTQNVMTIDYRILIGHQIDKRQKVTIQKIINQTFKEIDATYNKWNPESEISKLNKLKANETAQLSSQLHAFFLRIDHLVNISNGLFDPTIEPLQHLWKDKLVSGSIPTLDEIDAIKPSLGWDKIDFKNGVFSKKDDRTQLDFGGIAKGLAVDLLLENLNKAKFDNVLVEWGGEMRASGEHPDHRPWNIYIRKLGNPNPDDAIAIINLNNQAIATSGDYFQNWTVQSGDGKITTYTHIFNPKTLQPILVQKDSIASASLLADDCVTADALAKVLMLFESENEAREWIHGVQKIIPNLSYWIYIIPA
ncbi:MAG: FAD:protein FMN transferase [Parachlamydiaceae bacterium]|nr:FAD:protein FMN transferase [Parachlamydiaceae bacterium]